MNTLTIKPEEIEKLFAVARKHSVRALTITETSFEVVFEPLTVEKEKPAEVVQPEGAMPTRQEIEEATKRIREGGMK